MTILAITRAPLINFDSRAGKVTFEIGPETEATLLPDWVLDDDSLPSELSEFQSYVLRGGGHKRVWCLSISRNSSDRDEGIAKKSFEARAHLVDDRAAAGESDVETILAALRLIEAKRVWVPLIWTVLWSEDGECVGSSVSNYGARWDALGPHIGMDDPFGSARDLIPTAYILETPHLSLLETLVSRLKQTAGSGSAEAARLNLAVHRFNRSSNTVSLADQLIDLWVALEALFSSAADPEGRRTEFTCRRAASFATNTALNTEDLLKESYRHRSDIIHGRQDEIGLPSLIATTEEICRDTIRKRLTDVDSPPTSTRHSSQARGATDDPAI